MSLKTVMIGAANTLPSITPNSSGLPGITTISSWLGGLEVVAGLACLLGLLVGAGVWAVAAHANNSSHAHSGRTAVLSSLLAGVLVGAASGLVNFFINAGSSVH